MVSISISQIIRLSIPALSPKTGRRPRLRLGESNDSLKPTTNDAPKEYLG